MSKTNNEAKQAGKPYNGMNNDGYYYLDGRGYKKFTSGKSKDLEKIIYPIKYAQYQFDLLKKYHRELLNAEKNKNNIITSLQ
jgi:hypothetical protein